MKRSVIAGLLMSFLFSGMLSQSAAAQTLKDFFGSDATSALYLGIDFTKAKLIDDPKSEASDIVERQFEGINQLVITESKKFDLSSAFHKPNIDHDIAAVNKRNEKVDEKQLMSTNTSDFHRLKEDDISSLVKGFDFGGKKGIGILFVMEAMSKSGKAAAIWITFIDMGSKKVLLTERLEEKVGMAIGFRNTWASAIKKLLDEIEADKLKQWKTKFQ